MIASEQENMGTPWVSSETGKGGNFLVELRTHPILMLAE